MEKLEKLAIHSWGQPFSPEMQMRAAEALELGKILLLLQLDFMLQENEKQLYRRAM